MLTEQKLGRGKAENSHLKQSPKQQAERVPWGWKETFRTAGPPCHTPLPQATSLPRQLAAVGAILIKSPQQWSL